MAAADRPPEETIRRWLTAHGPVEVGVDAIEQTWGLETLTAGDRRRIGRVLEEAGVICEPPLRRAGRRDKLRLSLSEEAQAAEAKPAPAPVAAAPEPVAAAPEPVAAAPEPVAAAGPDPREPAAPVREAPARDSTRVLRLAPLALGLMVAGALGPWAKSIFVVDYGLDRAGLLVIGLAATAGLLLLAHSRFRLATPLPLGAALAATVAVAVVVSEFRELLDDELLGPAWGLYVAFAGSAAMVTIAMLALARR